MYQPYPSGTQMPEVHRGPVPPSIANAVRIMYAGAALSILGILIDVLTVNATKRAIERRSPNLTVTQVDARQHVLIIAFIIGGLIGAALWVFIARQCQAGKNWARITGTVFFAIATLDAAVGSGVPEAGLVKIWGLLTWLVGLVTVILLWQRASTAYLTAAKPS
ncbi:MAG: hypothetical protein ACRDOB_14775 [Streptosporangiaceae bacterium]